MTPEAVFKLVNVLVLPQWLLMLVAPQWRLTRWLVRSYLVPIGLAVIYIIYLLGGSPIDFSAFGSLSGIKNLFAQGGDGVTLAGWVHYLAFDLVVGSFILRNAHENQIPHGLIVLPLLLCFMAGPVGLLVYWLIRLVRTGRLAP